MKKNPKYLDVYEKLRQLAALNVDGGKLSSIKELCDRYRVSLSTMTSALDLLERDGLIRREARKGLFFVSRDLQKGGGRIALLMPSNKELFFAIIVETVRQYLAKFGMEVVVTLYDTGFGSEQTELMRLLYATGIDGVLYLPTQISAQMENLLTELAAKMPVVQFDRQQGRGITPFVGYEDYRSSHAAAEYLLEQGHREIGLITANIDPVENPSERLRGFLDGLRENGCPLDPANIITYYYFDPDLAGDAVELLSSKKCPTAFFSVNDVYLSRFMRKAAFVGKYIPGDLGFICLSIPELMDRLPFKATYFDQPTREAVVEATKLLLKQLGGEAVPREEMLLPFRFVRGESCRKITPAACLLSV